MFFQSRLSRSAVFIGLVLPVAASPAAAAGGLVASPTVLEFGAQDVHVGAGSWQATELSNSTGGAVSVSSVTITGSESTDFSVAASDCATIPDAGACTVSVQFDPSTPGLKSALLEVTDDVGTTSVSLTGTGATGALSGSPPTYAAQPYFYGSQAQNVDVHNYSAYAVTAVDASLSGPDAAFFSIDYNGCNITLSPSNSCSVGVRFSPTAPGTKTAQLLLTNDGTTSPLQIPLTATALFGPVATALPALYDFGTVAVGSPSRPGSLAIRNDGDAPLQIQQLLLLSGSPQLFSISGDGCAQQTIDPGNACTFSVSFKPTSAGERGAAIYVIANQGPVVTIPLIGEGEPAPIGRAIVTGRTVADNNINCTPADYPDGTVFTYTWLRDGSIRAGERGSQLKLTDADVGKRFTCRIEATNPIGSETRTSPQTAPVAPRDLSQLPDSLVDPSTCRTVHVPKRLNAGRATIAMKAGRPVTPWSQLVAISRGRTLHVEIDGFAVGSGQSRASITPRALQTTPDGVHVMTVKAGSATAATRIRLGPCRLAVRLDGGPGRASVTTVSAAAGMSNVRIRLPSTLTLGRQAKRLGQVEVQIAGLPVQTFPLYGTRSSFNGITVSLRNTGIDVTGLPPQAGVVQVSLAAGIIIGHRGPVRASALLRGDQHRTHTRTSASWSR
jgi:hypothetical protein